MRKWKSHKIVEAEKIDSVYTSSEIDGAQLNLDAGLAPLEEYLVDEKTYKRLREMASPGTLVGGYVVVYEDGYISWSPPGAFIGGYTEVET